MIAAETTQNHPVVLFDGVCNFCNASINFIIKQDTKKKFHFAALQSEAGQKLLEEYGLPKEGFDSFVLIDKGRVYKKSSAGLRVYGKLAWYWRWSQAFWLAPQFLRDAVYDLIAKNRYKWFGKKEACMIPGAEVKERFLK
ncbi:MAG TPA: thiol-disulfide oxidoreductase DCC family protein [Flavisolibacter sp.]|jgi:predicted DCC family thiol-disulfide oxidoreductase YuxK|nr:thiol-disulfide oxidoreductase DCC family protein [Flavisolibacter sp.]